MCTNYTILYKNTKAVEGGSEIQSEKNVLEKNEKIVHQFI